MKAQDFQLDSKSAASLTDIDSLVDLGLSRERSERVVKAINDLIDGPWADLLAPMANPEGDNEKALIQTFWIAYITLWVSERTISAAVTQELLLAHFIKLDGGQANG